MTRVRLVGLTVFALALLPLVGGVFGTFVMVAIVPFAVVAGLGIAMSARPLPYAAAGFAIGLVVSTLVTTFLAGGRSGVEFAFAFGPAVSRLFTTSWPSPQRPELVGLTSMLAATGLGVSQLVGRSDRYRVAALVPTLAVAGVLTVAGSAEGPHVVVWCWFLLAAIAYLVLSTKGASLRTPDPQVAIIGALAVIVVAVLGTVLPADGRYDPRRSNVEELDAFIPPVENFASLATLTPPQVLFKVGGDLSGLERFRTMVYDDYDGTGWQVGFDLEEVGTVVRAGTSADHKYTVWPLDERLRFVPFAGEPVRVDAKIAANSERDVVALIDDDVTAETIEVSTHTGADGSAPLAGEVVTTETSGPFATAAKEIVGGAPDLAGQLDLLAETMRTTWKLNPPDQPSPLQSKLLQDFVTQGRRGGASQFVSGFVLMARTLGADARLVGGFVLDSAAAGGDDAVLDSSDARLWAEVRTEDGGWRAYDPVPLRPTPADESSAVPTPVLTESEARPPVQPPTDPDRRVEDDTDDPTAPARNGWPTWVVLSVSAILLVVGGIPLIVGYKGVRRWFWMGVGSPARRTRGAWAETTSTLIDAGLPVRNSWTDFDIVRRSASVEGAPTDDLARLAHAARLVAFAPQPLQISSQDLAANRAAVRSVRAGIRSCHTWRERLRMRMSVRSVWPTTRTPVLNRKRGRNRSSPGR